MSADGCCVGGLVLAYSMVVALSLGNATSIFLSLVMKLWARPFQSLRSERGGMILMVVVLSAVLSVIATVWLTTFKSQVEAVESGNQRQQLVGSFERLRVLFSGVESCTTLLTAAPITYSANPAAPMTIASLDTGAAILTVHTAADHSITAIQMIHEATLPQVYDSAGVLTNHHRARVEVAGQIKTGNRISDFIKDYAVDVTVSGGGTVTGCYRGQNSAEVACQVMNGVYVPVSGTCTLPSAGPAQGSCPTGECIYGFNDQNERLCRPM